MTQTTDSPEEKIQELQMVEHQLQQILMEKQTQQIELNEIENALGEVNKTTDDVYRMLGSIMLKADKGSLIKELDEKRRIVELRLTTLEKQEKNFEEKMVKLRSDVNSIVTKKR